MEVMQDKSHKPVDVVETQTLRLELPSEGLCLEKGGVLREVTVAYERSGVLAPDRSNVVFVCHALTGDAHVTGFRPGDDPEGHPTGWWNDVIGSGLGIDTEHYHVICANVLGGCSGTTGPASVNPETGKPYGSAFPEITVGDIVDVHVLLLRQLGFEKICAVIGGSFGGMQALEWAVRYPESCGNTIVVAAAASLSSQALAFDIIGRQAIVQDPNWGNGDYYASESPDAGLARARKLAHITYLSQDMMKDKFGRAKQKEWIERDESFHASARKMFRSYFQVESYLEHQGEKFIRRFDANSYLHITRAMDEFDLAEKYGSLEKAMKRIDSRVMLIALSGDWLFTAEQAEELVGALLAQHKHVSYCQLDAPAGHDAFLTHTKELKIVVRAFMPAHRYPHTPEKPTPEHESIVSMVPQGARVLDLGCGNGELLALLKVRRQVAGLGLEINLGDVVHAIHIGQDVLRADMDEGLESIPSQAYDVAILSETLQVVDQPEYVINQLLRIAKEGVISFPNFGYWGVRLHLAVRGTMPKGRHIPYEWYNTPNIHLFTLADFRKMCKEKGIIIRDLHCHANRPLSRLAIKLGLKNLASERVIVRIAKG